MKNLVKKSLVQGKLKSYEAQSASPFSFSKQSFEEQSEQFSNTTRQLKVICQSPMIEHSQLNKCFNTIFFLFLFLNKRDKNQSKIY